MASNFSSSTIISCTILCLLSSAANATVFDVTKYGGKPGVDLIQSLTAAWKEACEATTPSQILVPAGIYPLSIITLMGPCKAAIDLHIQGTLKAPSAIKGDSWVSFDNLDHFTLTGNGIFDGMGKPSWETNCATNKKCGTLAANLRFNFITNGMVRGISSVDSKNFHVNVLGCKNLTFEKFTIRAPKTSLNTDGIHIGRSIGVNITDTLIGTGDDCISIGDDSQQIRITRVKCGPGHGISIGSLGRYPGEKPVAGVYVKNCTISEAENGLRIKSWPALEQGLATDLHFEDIVMNNVSNPIIIDQKYCPWSHCNPNLPSKVKISNVSFKNVRGTSKTPVAVQLTCSSGHPCQNVVLSDIKLVYNGPEGPATSKCENVKPQMLGQMTPGC